mgnify:CR=1 FL=1
MKRGSYIGCGRHIKSTHWFGCVYSFFVCVVWLWCGKLCNNVRAAQLIKGTQSCFSTGADECTFQFQHLFRTRYELFTITRLRSYEHKHNHDMICNVSKATLILNLDIISIFIWLEGNSHQIISTSSNMFGYMFVSLLWYLWFDNLETYRKYTRTWLLRNYLFSSRSYAEVIYSNLNFSSTSRIIQPEQRVGSLTPLAKPQ